MIDVGYTSFNQIDIDGYKSKIFEIDSICFNSKKEQTFIPGKCFLVTIDNWQYAHLIQECIGQYEFIKQYIPDLKIYFLFPADYSQSEEIKSNNVTSLVIKDLMEKYGIKDFDVLNYSTGITFEKTYYIFNFFIKYVKDYVPSGLPIHNHANEDFSLQLEISRLISKLFNKEKIKNVNKNKIFISKTKSDFAYKGFMKKKEELMNTYSGDEFLLKLKELQGDNKYNSMEFNNKIRVYDNQDKIENFFKSLGYDVVYNEDIGLFDQINMYHNATHIASINGTGCYNSIFSEKGTKVFMINTHNKFYWFFDHLISDSLGNENVFIFPDQDSRSNEEISIDDILSGLEKHKEFM
jgi:hypothetical protein